MSRARECVCEGVCGYDDADYVDVCDDAGCAYCLGEQSRRDTTPMPGEAPLFGG